MKEKIRELIDLLNYYTKFYNEGKPQISDEEWDYIYFDLKKREEESGIIYSDSPTQSIQRDEVASQSKITHSSPMLSLDKTKSENEFFLFGGGQEVAISLKMDGLSLRLTYEDGKLVQAETRGNGIEGNLVTYLAYSFRNIPLIIPYKNKFEIEGEAIITYEDFKQFDGIYKNPRNLAAGSMSLLDPKEAYNRHLKFVAWKVITDISPYYSQRMYKAGEMGFTTVPFIINADGDIHKIIEELKKTAETLSYPIDGLVATFDDINFGLSLGTTAHHPLHSLAFKFYDETYETVLKGITYDIGRTEVLTPVAIFEPIDTGDSIVERASLSNLTVMRDTLHSESGWEGQKIWVSKRNQIIPKVEEAEEDNEFTKRYFHIPAVCPVCGGRTEIKESDSGVENLYCTNSECPGKLSTKIDHYVGKKGLDIKGLSKKTLEKLIDWEWVSSIKDIYTLKEHRAEWIQKEGFGAKSVDNILNAIEEHRKCELWQFISAFGIPLIGSTYAKEIGKRVKTWSEFRDMIEGKYHFNEWDGFGVEMTVSLWKFDYSEMNFLIDSGTVEILSADWTEPINSIASDFISNKNFVITGSLNHYKNRAELQKFIEDNGGKVIGSVSKKTDYLINNDPASSSAKNVTAKKLGVKIITEDEFLKNI